jgi:hypothetical protein
MVGITVKDGLHRGAPSVSPCVMASCVLPAGLTLGGPACATLLPLRYTGGAVALVQSRPGQQHQGLSCMSPTLVFQSV